MEIIKLLAAGFFLPLFPLGMMFNLLFQRTRFAGLRAIMLLLWPLPGVWLVTSATHIPDWLLLWALFSAVLYGFRAVVVKEFGVWIGFLATSAWALGWTVLGIDTGAEAGRTCHGFQPATGAPGFPGSRTGTTLRVRLCRDHQRRGPGTAQAVRHAGTGCAGSNRQSAVSRILFHAQ